MNSENLKWKQESLKTFGLLIFDDQHFEDILRRMGRGRLTDAREEKILRVLRQAEIPDGVELRRFSPGLDLPIRIYLARKVSEGEEIIKSADESIDFLWLDWQDDHSKDSELKGLRLPILLFATASRPIIVWMSAYDTNDIRNSDPAWLLGCLNSMLKKKRQFFHWEDPRLATQGELGQVKSQLWDQKEFLDLSLEPARRVFAESLTTNGRDVLRGFVRELGGLVNDPTATPVAFQRISALRVEDQEKSVWWTPRSLFPFVMGPLCLRYWAGGHLDEARLITALERLRSVTETSPPAAEFLLERAKDLHWGGKDAMWDLMLAKWNKRLAELEDLFDPGGDRLAGELICFLEWARNKYEQVKLTERGRRSIVESEIKREIRFAIGRFLVMHSDAVEGNRQPLIKVKPDIEVRDDILLPCQVDIVEGSLLELFEDLEDADWRLVRVSVIDSLFRLTIVLHGIDRKFSFGEMSESLRFHRGKVMNALARLSPFLGIQVKIGNQVASLQAISDSVAPSAVDRNCELTFEVLLKECRDDT